MNILVSITAVLGFLCAAACALWAMAERTRAVRAQTRADLLEEQRQSGAEILREQAAQSANAVGRELVNRATETFRAQDLLAQAKLEAQLKPVAETLAKFEAHVAAVEKIRAEETGGVKAQIAQMLEATTATREEARKLSAALRRGAGVQGRWGEQMLRNVLEMAGLQARIDFQEQVTLVGDKGPVRPDVVSQFFTRVRDELGLGHVHLHSLRHFAATQLAAQPGVTVRTIAGRLGHADASLTMRVYAAFFPAADVDAADHLGRALTSG